MHALFSHLKYPNEFLCHFEQFLLSRSLKISHYICTMTWSYHLLKIKEAKIYLKQPTQEIKIHFRLWQDKINATENFSRFYMLYLGLVPGTQTP